MQALGLNLNVDDPRQSDILRLARGPVPVGTSYNGYKVNGFRFHTRGIEKKRKTQNSGVMVNATTTSFQAKKTEGQSCKRWHIMAS